MFDLLSKHYDLCAKAFIQGAQMNEMIPIP